MIQNEIWENISDYDGLYKISNLGKVIRIKTNRILKYRNSRGYVAVSLSKDGKVKDFKVHRLVAMAFVSNPNNKPDVNHIDGNKHNNMSINLEWTTHSENIQHGYDKCLLQPRKGIDNSLSKAIIQFDKQMNKLFEYDSITEASQKISITGQNISQACLGKQKTAGGFIWKFKEKDVKDDNTVDSISTDSIAD